MTTRLTNLSYRKIALCDRGANPEAFITLMKRATEMSKTPTVEELQKQVETLTAEKITLEATVKDLEKKIPTPEPTEEELRKNLPAAIRKQMEDQEKTLKEQGEQLAKMADDKVRNVAIQKAAVFKSLGNADDLSGFLYDLRKAAPTVADKFEAMAKAWNEQLRQSALFKSAGVPGYDADAGDPEAQLETLAKAHQNANPELTYEMAYAKVSKTREGVQLMKAISAAKRGA